LSITYLFGKFDSSILKRMGGKNKNNTQTTTQESEGF
jgi:hypothetical protein